MSRKQLLDAVASEIMVCTKCRLSKSRKNAVPGEGTSYSKIMLVGEGPGKIEDNQGRPFVGQAGKFLDSLLSDANLIRQKIFICNIVRCRPPKNRKPRQDEIEACTPYLDRQIRIIKPKMIVTVGSCSTNYIFSKAGLTFDSITKTHGRHYETTILDLPTTVFVTFHPAASLYSAKYKQQLTADFQCLKSKLTERKIIKG